MHVKFRKGEAHTHTYSFIVNIFYLFHVAKQVFASFGNTYFKLNHSLCFSTKSTKPLHFIKYILNGTKFLFIN